MATCIICGKPMATVRAKSGKAKFGLYYSCTNKRCSDYNERYVRLGYPSDKKVAEIRSHRALPYRKKK